MSKQELTKWKNKFKVWIVLHPNFDKNTCDFCQFKNENCSQFKTLTYNKKIDEISIELYEYVKFRDKECIEWIKHV